MISVLSENRYCKSCGKNNIYIEEQTFANKTVHHKIVCKSCGSFNGYQKRADTESLMLLKDFKITQPIVLGDVFPYLSHSQKEFKPGSVLTIIAKIRSDI